MKRLTTQDEIIKYCNEFCELNESDELSVIECAMKHRDCPIGDLPLYAFIEIQNRGNTNHPIQND